MSRPRILRIRSQQMSHQSIVRSLQILRGIHRMGVLIPIDIPAYLQRSKANDHGQHLSLEDIGL